MVSPVMRGELVIQASSSSFDTPTVNAEVVERLMGWADTTFTEQVVEESTVLPKEVVVVTVTVLAAEEVGGVRTLLML